MTIEVGNIDIAVLTQDGVVSSLASSLVVVPKKEYNDSMEALIQFIIATNLAQEVGKLLRKDPENKKQCLKKALEHLYEEYPDLLDTNEQGKGCFGSDVTKLLNDHVGIPNRYKTFLEAMTAFYHSKQHSGIYKDSKSDSN